MFESSDNIYTDYRIPAIVITPSGEIYVAYECRAGNSDWASIDLRVQKSNDGGCSFTEVLLLQGNGHTLNNPLLIAGEGVIHFIYCLDYSRVFHLCSNDGGLHWRQAGELTNLFDDLPHTVVAVGPGHGVITGDGTMVLPVWLAYDPEDTKAHKPSFLTTIYSKNGGETWNRGEVLQNDDLSDANETAIALTSDGRVLLSIRNRHPAHQRYWAVSRNGYSNWEYPGLDERFIDPRCMAGMCNDGRRIFFCNCESMSDRVSLTVKVSDDDFRSFKRIPVSEKAGYSDIAFYGGMLYVLYETSDMVGDQRTNHRLHLTTLRV